MIDYTASKRPIGTQLSDEHVKNCRTCRRARGSYLIHLTNCLIWGTIVTLNGGGEQLVAHRAHNPAAAGSNPAPATIASGAKASGAFVMEWTLGLGACAVAHAHVEMDRSRRRGAASRVLPKKGGRRSAAYVVVANCI